MRLHKLLPLASLAWPAATAPGREQQQEQPSQEDEIHFQWALCDPNPGIVLEKLGYSADDEPYKQYMVTYYDTNPPNYTEQGVMFRTKVKKIHHSKHDVSLVKIRFPGSDGPREVAGADECLWDRYGSSVYYTCSQLSLLDSGSDSDSDSAIMQAPWSEGQVEFAEHQIQNITWEDLVPYGPFQDPKWKVRVAGRKAKFDSVVAAEYGTHLMEIEAQLPRAGSREVYEEMTRELEAMGVVLCEPQDTKTLRLFKAMGLQRDSELEEEEEEAEDEDLVSGLEVEL